jgi:acetyl-CoA carboxylase biotin carboxyl carrier protein
MDQQQIKAFIDAMAASDLDEMEVSHDGWTLRLVRRAPTIGGGVETRLAPGLASSEPVRVPAAPSTGPDEVRAPMFGVVHLQQAPGEPPFVKVGDVIEAGQMLCTIEAMKVFNEVRAERGGRVCAVHIASGTEVEAGQALVTFESVPHV